MLKFRAFLLLCFVTLIFPISRVYAFESITGDSVIVPKDRIIDGSLFVAGSSVHMDAIVNGDLYCAGRDVVVTGLVTGDVLCAGQSVQLQNTTKGNVRIAGQMVELSGIVGGNVTTLGQTISLQQEATISGDLVSLAQTTRITGIVKRDFAGFGELVSIDGTIGRNVDATLDSLTIGNDTKIGGNIHYVSDHSASIGDTASISGMVARSDPPTPSNTKNKSILENTAKVSQVQGIGFLILTLLTGILLIVFLPKRFTETIATVRELWARTFLRGLAFIILAPALAVLLAITIIGIPFSMIIIFLMLLAYILGRTLVVAFVGKLILEKLYPKKASSLGWSLGLGMVLFWAILNIPGFGGLISLFVTLLGFGAVTHFVLKKNE